MSIGEKPKTALDIALHTAGPTQSGSEAAYTSYARVLLVRGTPSPPNPAFAEMGDLARWVGEYVRDLKEAWSGDLVFGTTPDGSAVRIAKVLNPERTTIIYCDLPPQQAACGWVVRHAIDHMMDKAPTVRRGEQLQAGLHSGELWKFALCKMVENGRQKGILSGDTLKIVTRTSTEDMNYERACDFSVAALDAGGCAYACRRFELANIAFDMGLHYVAPPEPPPVELDLAKTDAAFEGF